MSFNLDNLLKTYKKEGVLIPKVERHFATRPQWEDREIKVVHPSDIYPDDYCGRSVCYRIQTGKVHSSDTSIVRESAFADGHEYHYKWQSWAWDVGALEGRFRCLSCGRGDWSMHGYDEEDQWWAHAPTVCDACGSPRRFLQYGEVPIRIPRYKLSGSADGIVEDRVLEVKSVGLGTVRMEMPEAVRNRTTDGVVDLAKLWKDIRQPFPQHIRQVNIYGHLLGHTRALIVYDYKPGGQYPKEFDLKLNPETAKPYLQRALDIKEAVEHDELLPCPHDGCKKCEPYDAKNEDTDGPEGEDVRGSTSRGRGGGRGVPVTDEAGEKSTQAPRGRDRAKRPRPDGGAKRDDAVAGLLGGSARANEHRGGKRRQASTARGGTPPRYERRKERNVSEG